MLFFGAIKPGGGKNKSVDFFFILEKNTHSTHIYLFVCEIGRGV